MIYKGICLTACIGFLSSLQATSCSSQIPEYVSICKKAAEEDLSFLTFKSDPGYRSVLEHLDKETGWQYLKRICEDSPEWLPLFDRFRMNDVIGSPRVEDFGIYGVFSSTTLRYIKVASDLKNKWGSLDGWRVLEIGGGYGGQCKILMDLFPSIQYTLLDLPECNALSKRYLHAFGIDHVSFISPGEWSKLASQYDLIISNYAFAELDAAQQEEYLHQVLVRGKRGYMTCNHFNHFFGLDTLSIERWARILAKRHYQVQIQEEDPNTSPECLLIMWDAR